MMRGGLRKGALTLHVTVSVGWLGATASFLALALVGLRSSDVVAAASAYVAMGWLARLVILPLALAALLTGLVQALGTPWGLARHYWVLFKLVLTAGATLALLLHLRPIEALAGAASAGPLGPGDLPALRLQLVVNAAAATAALLATTTLAVVKPRGLTLYGRRKRADEAREP